MTTRIDWDRIRSGDDEYIEQLVSIDRDDPADDMQNQAALYASAARSWAQAKSRLSKAEIALEEAESRVFDKYRDDGLAIGHASEKVDSHSDVVELKHIVRKIQHEVDMKRKLLHALSHRKDMLVQIGADRRAEMDLT